MQVVFAGDADKVALLERTKACLLAEKSVFVPDFEGSSGFKDETVTGRDLCEVLERLHFKARVDFAVGVIAKCKHGGAIATALFDYCYGAENVTEDIEDFVVVGLVEQDAKSLVPSRFHILKLVALLAPMVQEPGREIFRRFMASGTAVFRVDFIRSMAPALPTPELLEMFKRETDVVRQIILKSITSTPRPLRNTEFIDTLVGEGLAPVETSIAGNNIDAYLATPRLPLRDWMTWGERYLAEIRGGMKEWLDKKDVLMAGTVFYDWQRRIQPESISTSVALALLNLCLELRPMTYAPRSGDSGLVHARLQQLSQTQKINDPAKFVQLKLLLPSNAILARIVRQDRVAFLLQHTVVGEHGVYFPDELAACCNFFLQSSWLTSRSSTAALLPLFSKCFAAMTPARYWTHTLGIASTDPIWSTFGCFTQALLNVFMTPLNLAVAFHLLEEWNNMFDRLVPADVISHAIATAFPTGGEDDHRWELLIPRLSSVTWSTWYTARQRPHLILLPRILAKLTTAVDLADRALKRSSLTQYSGAFEVLSGLADLGKRNLTLDDVARQQVYDTLVQRHQDQVARLLRAAPGPLLRACLTCLEDIAADVLFGLPPGASEDSQQSRTVAGVRTCSSLPVCPSGRLGQTVLDEVVRSLDEYAVNLAIYEKREVRLVEGMNGVQWVEEPQSVSFSSVQQLVSFVGEGSTVAVEALLRHHTILPKPRLLLVLSAEKVQRLPDVVALVTELASTALNVANGSEFRAQLVAFSPWFKDVFPSATEEQRQWFMPTFNDLSLPEVREYHYAKMKGADMDMRAAGRMSLLNLSVNTTNAVDPQRFLAVFEQVITSFKNEAGHMRGQVHSWLVSNMDKIISIMKTEEPTRLMELLKTMAKDDAAKRDSTFGRAVAGLCRAIVHNMLNDSCEVSVEMRRHWLRTALFLDILGAQKAKGQEGVDAYTPSLPSFGEGGWVDVEGTVAAAVKDATKRMHVRYKLSALPEHITRQLVRLKKREATAPLLECVTLYISLFDEVKRDEFDTPLTPFKAQVVLYRRLIAMCGARFVEVPAIVTWIEENCFTVAAFQDAHDVYNEICTVLPGTRLFAFEIARKLVDFLFRTAARQYCVEQKDRRAAALKLGAAWIQMRTECVEVMEWMELLKDNVRAQTFVAKFGYDGRARSSSVALDLSYVPDLLAVDPSFVWSKDILSFILEQRDDMLSSLVVAYKEIPGQRPLFQAGELVFPRETLVRFDAKTSATIAEATRKIIFARHATAALKATSVAAFVENPAVSGTSIVDLIRDLLKDDSPELVEAVVLSIFKSDSLWQCLSVMLSPAMLSSNSSRMTASLLDKCALHVSKLEMIKLLGVLLNRETKPGVFLQRCFVRCLFNLVSEPEGHALLMKHWGERATLHEDVVVELVKLSAQNMLEPILKDVAEKDDVSERALLELFRLRAPGTRLPVAPAHSWLVEHGLRLSIDLNDEEDNVVEAFSTAASKSSAVALRNEQKPFVRSLMASIISTTDNAGARALARTMFQLFSPASGGAYDESALNFCLDTLIDIITSSKGAPPRVGIRLAFEVVGLSQGYAQMISAITAQEIRTTGSRRVDFTQPYAVHFRKFMNDLLDVALRADLVDSNLERTLAGIAYAEVSSHVQSAQPALLEGGPFEQKLRMLSVTRTSISNFAPPVETESAFEW